MPNSNRPLLVRPDWLFEHIFDPTIVVVDCRWRLGNPSYGDQAFFEGHIPGAVRLDMERDLSAPPGRYGGRHPLPSPRIFERKLSDLGIGHQTHVVCYDDDAAGSARAWFCLTYHGHAQVSVLDGGVRAWLAAGYPLSQDPPATQPKSFVARPNPRLVVDYQTVSHLRDVLPLIDARAPERFHGEIEPVDAVAGHIPGAVNYPHTAVLTEQGTYRSREELQQLFAPVLDQAHPPIVYCGSGVTACINLLALRQAGVESLLYPGSWSDWIQHEDAPIG